ncbi:hypothetical protein COLO4_21427 [Corchorus olitorius]|uniref:Uncharacterized protein n=1 Tax=Corchorus olitorius TaxID=93759 RepID=A0A1R3ITG3_9ROSI|nr:hypothetical protein COLO4_21427 [Corchorus olitorius]
MVWGVRMFISFFIAFQEIRVNRYIYVEHSVAEPVLAPMQIEYEIENPVDGVENPVDDEVENPVDDGVGNPVEEVEMPGNGDDAEIEKGDDAVNVEDVNVHDVNVEEDVNEEGRKDAEEPSVKKSKDKRLEFLSESGVDVEHVGVDPTNKHPADYDLGEDAGCQSDYPQSDDVGDTEDDEDKQLSPKSRRKEKTEGTERIFLGPKTDPSLLGTDMEPTRSVPSGSRVGRS